MIASCPAFSLTSQSLSPICTAKYRSTNAGKLSSSCSANRSSRKKSKSLRSSRKSAIKKSFTQEQVSFTTPLSDNPSIAIIGGGLSGLLCAATLEERGIRSTVFDTGVHGLGGRMATRTLIESEKNLVFDHAAQFFTASDERFQKLVDSWISQGLVLEWKGAIGTLEAGGHYTPLPNSIVKYIGIKGMRSLTDSIHKNTNIVDIVRPCWISSIEPFNGMWHLSENGKNQGSFDAVVIAHNGKGASRLLSFSGLPQLFSRMKKLELSSIWTLLAAFEDPLPVLLDGAFVKGIDSVSWMGNNTSKLYPLQSGNGDPQCWTFFSTASYAKRNMVPQEKIPNVRAEKVKLEMLHGVEAALGMCKGLLQKPFYTRVQLWGTALPLNSPGVPCIFDPFGRAGICGDWLLGSSMEDAALSGISMGNHMADYFHSGGTPPEDFAAGLHEEFKAVSGYDIGRFPGLDFN